VRRSPRNIFVHTTVNCDPATAPGGEIRLVRVIRGVFVRA